MKSSGKNRNETKSSFQDTVVYLNSRLKKYDNPHENFVVPWQMEVKQKKEFYF